MTHKMVATYVSGTPNDPTPAVQPSIFSALSSRELEILRGIARGSSNKEIGRDLGIAETTVKVHVQNVLRKLQVTTRVHAAVMATEIGFS
jgi:two-component system nitrate/nitrite response regulator NarL